MCAGAQSYKYDAFVSYRGTAPDEHFVIRQLRPRLESEAGLKLCLHVRDFMPGEGTQLLYIEHILNAIIDKIKKNSVSHFYQMHILCLFIEVLYLY